MVRLSKACNQSPEQVKKPSSPSDHLNYNIKKVYYGLCYYWGPTCCLPKLKSGTSLIFVFCLFVFWEFSSQSLCFYIAKANKCTYSGYAQAKSVFSYLLCACVKLPWLNVSQCETGESLYTCVVQVKQFIYSLMAHKHNQLLQYLHSSYCRS